MGRKYVQVASFVGQEVLIKISIAVTDGKMKPVVETFAMEGALKVRGSIVCSFDFTNPCNQAYEILLAGRARGKLIIAGQK